MSILERLYMGNLCPFEESLPHSTDYRLLSNKIGEEREYFEGILSAEEKERFKAWNEMMFRYEDITSYEKFKHGFSLGIMLASEIFAEKETDKGMEKKDNGNLLDILVKARTGNALDEAAGKSTAYQEILKRQDKAFDTLDRAGLSSEQRTIVDRTVSAANECGAAYGAAAYELGLQDGIKLMSELKEVKQ